MGWKLGIGAVLAALLIAFYGLGGLTLLGSKPASQAIAAQRSRTGDNTESDTSENPDEVARALAARAAYLKDGEALNRLEAGAKSHAPSAEYGLGKYNRFLIDKAYMSTPLVNDIEENLVSGPFSDQQQWFIRALLEPDRENAARMRQAIRWWRIAAKDGDPAAQAELGNEYEGELMRIAAISSAAGATQSGDSPRAQALNSELMRRACSDMVALLKQSSLAKGWGAGGGYMGLAMIHLGNLAAMDQYLSGTDCDQFDGGDQQGPGAKYLENAARAGDEGAVLTIWGRDAQEGNQDGADHWMRALRAIEIDNTKVGIPGSQAVAKCLETDIAYADFGPCVRQVSQPQP